VNARSALFDLYGDHLVNRGRQAPIAALIRCLGALGIAAPAVRTAVSRMVRQEWLVATRTDQGPGYALTPRAVRRLDDAASRIYRTDEAPWDGRWHLVVVERTRDRSRRDRLRSGLRYLGYGSVDDTTWVAARPSSELDALLATEGAAAERFTAEHDGDTLALVRRIWDLDAIGAAYDEWIAHAERIVAGITPDSTDESAFAARTTLVHEWRKFLFRDPHLPDELLPKDWAGRRGAQYFDDQAARLLPGTARFIDEALGRRTS
jgi:phenylacetic acid degradation operon negative regulatory protein